MNAKELIEFLKRHPDYHIMINSLTDNRDDDTQATECDVDNKDKMFIIY